MMKQKQFILNNGLQFAWAVAVFATGGSLYLSEVMEYAPCELCWFQRIFMYPLVFILGVASVKKDFKVYRYVLPLAMVGGCISIYHYLVQKTAFFKEHSTTCGIVPCDIDYLDWFGVITIPMLALIAFIIITVVMLLVRKASKNA